MPEAKIGDTVRVTFTGNLEDGTVFGSTGDVDPLEFTIGEGHVIRGFEKAVIGMNPGESKTVKVTTDEAFGPRREEMVVVIERDQFPAHIQPEVGKQFQVPTSDGRLTLVTVTDVSESSVTLDGNHPLAGKDLIFTIKLIEIA